MNPKLSIRHFLVFIYLIIVNGNLHAQQVNTAPQIANVMPVSPNAAALGKYGEIPVGYYTGIPSISLPIYEVKSGSLSLPISLSYHAGGVKVEEIASWVGLGWSLNAGGIISRQVRGIPDELDGGYLQQYNQLTKYLNGQMTVNERNGYFEDISAYVADAQQDIFSYNFGGESGKFIFDSTGNILTIPLSKNKFEFGPFLGQANTWKITDVHGNIYYFTEKEISNSVPVSNGGLSPTMPPASVTSWYITVIKNPTETDSIRFVYGSNFNQFSTLAGQTKYIQDLGSSSDCNGKEMDWNYSDVTVTGPQLSQIIFSQGTVTFNSYAQQRCDLPLSHALESIVIKSNNNKFYQKFKLNQHFTSCDDPELSRMFLDSVEVLNQTQKLHQYKFEYNGMTGLPGRRSYNQDHWGYYNGASNGVTFVPRTPFYFGGGGATHVYEGANRNPNEMFSQEAVLKSITYPTGGRTEFEYENNRANLPEQIQVIGASRSFAINTSYPNGSLLIEDTFIVNRTSDAALMLSTSSCGGGNATIGCPITYIEGPGIEGQLTVAQSTSRVLSPGTYHVTADLTSVTDSSLIQSYIFGVNWTELSQDTIQQKNTLVGGLRVKTITNYTQDNIKASIKKYKYLVSDTPAVSAGVLIAFPQYLGSQLHHNKKTLPFGEVYYDCNFITISSGSNLPLITTQGSYVAYQQVTELLGENGEFGKNVYDFYSPAQMPDIIGYTFPFPPSTSRDWRRGQLGRERTYKYANGSYILQRDKLSRYADTITNVYTGMHFSQDEFLNGIMGNKHYETVNFITETGRSYLHSDTTRTYEGSQVNEMINTYTYSSIHYQPVSVTTKNSKGEVVISTMKYPLDYSGLTGTTDITKGIKNLQTKNIISPVIEKYINVQNQGGSNNRMTSALLTSFKTDKPFQDTVWLTELINPTSSFAVTAVSGGNITKDANYRAKVIFNKYDQGGNVVEQQKPGDAKKSYIWDYYGDYPIAETINADSISIAYTSFESDGTGNWSVSSSSRETAFGLTGSKSYNLGNGNISKAGLTSGNKYIVTYWSKAGMQTVSGGSATTRTGKTVNGWALYEHLITMSGATATVSGSGLIDELRLYPVGAQMTTYTYEPLIGVTSQADANNVVVYYEYDGFNRLKNIKDFDGNIIKNYQYNYANSCGNNCYVLPLKTFTDYNTPGYPVGVFNINKQYIGIANNKTEYVTLWNSNSANQAVGTLSANSDSLRFNLNLATNATVPSSVYGLRYYQWDVFSPTTVVAGTDSLSVVDWGDGNRELVTGTRQAMNENQPFGYSSTWLRNRVMFYHKDIAHTYSNSNPRTITVFHNETTEYADVQYYGINDATQDAHIRGNYPERLKGLFYWNIGNSSDTAVKNFNKLSELVYAYYAFSGTTTTKHNNWQSLNNSHKLEWLKLNFKNGSEIVGNIRSNFSQLAYLELHDFKPDISTTWGSSGFPNLYLAVLGLEGGYSVTTAEIDAILINQAAASNLSTGRLGFGVSPTRSSASNAAYNALIGRSWTLSVNNP